MCLFFSGPTQEFTLKWRLITGDSLQLFTYTWNSWPLMRRILKCAEAPTVTLAIYLHLWRPGTLAPVALRLTMELSLSVLYIDLGLMRSGFEHPTYCMRGESSYRLHHRRVLNSFVQIAFIQYIKTILLDGNLNFTKRMPQYSKYCFLCDLFKC